MDLKTPPGKITVPTIKPPVKPSTVKSPAVIGQPTIKPPVKPPTVKSPAVIGQPPKVKPIVKPPKITSPAVIGQPTIKPLVKPPTVISQPTIKPLVKPPTVISQPPIVKPPKITSPAVIGQPPKVTSPSVIGQPTIVKPPTVTSPAVIGQPPKVTSPTVAVKPRIKLAVKPKTPLAVKPSTVETLTVGPISIIGFNKPAQPPFKQQDIYPSTFELPDIPHKEELLRQAQVSRTSRGTMLSAPLLSKQQIQIHLEQMSSLANVTPRPDPQPEVVSKTALMKIYKPDQQKAFEIANISISKLLSNSDNPYSGEQLNMIAQRLGIKISDTYDKIRENILNIVKLYHTNPDSVIPSNTGILTRPSTELKIRMSQPPPAASATISTVTSPTSASTKPKIRISIKK